jgi:hypothetical protein
MAVVGESAGGQGFSRPNPVSIHREYLNDHIHPLDEVTASDRVVYADTSKNEDTWCMMLGHYDAEYDSALRAFKGQWYGWRRAHF